MRRKLYWLFFMLAWRLGRRVMRRRIRAFGH